MAINPDNITTIRVDQLAPATLDLTKLIPVAETNGDLKQSSIQALANLIATTIEASGGVGYIAISISDGQQLPDVPENPSFFLAGAGTYLNINGYPNIICTDELNAIMSLEDHWELAVGIPIVAEVGVQTVTGSAVDNTDPLNPVINSTGGGGSQTLAQTLVLGNTTDGQDISISDGDAVILDNGSKLIKGTTDAEDGGNKGIALRCSIDYELKWEAGRLYVMEQDGFAIRAVLNNFTNIPTNTDDISKGFVVGSSWVLDNGDIYICTDRTLNNAVWVQKGGIGDVLDINQTAIEKLIDFRSIDENAINIIDKSGLTIETFDGGGVTLLTQSLINSNKIDMTLYDGAGAFVKSIRRNYESDRYDKGNFSTSVTYNDPTGNGVIKFPNVVNATKTLATLDDIPSTSTFVPYTGATADVDLDAFSLNAKSLHVKGTGGAGHLGLKHQSSNISASASESSLGANSSGNPIWKNASNAIQNILTNDNIVETITNGVTDKAPSENAVFDALALKQNVVSGVSDTEISYLDGVRSSIQAQIDALRLPIAIDTGNRTHTGTVVETVVASLQIPANTLDAVCNLFMPLDYGKTSANTVPIRLYRNTTNSISGATQIALYNTGSNRNGGFLRKMLVRGTSLDLLSSATTSIISNMNVDLLFTATDTQTIVPSGNIWILVTVTLDAVGTVFTTKSFTIEKQKLG
jgi:hypothetical protein